MKVLIFGATGMVGQGVLRECLLDPGVDTVQVVGRSGTGKTDPKLREILRPDLFDLASIEPNLAGFDACFFCLGVSSVGMDEKRYTHVTYDLTTSIAGILCRLNPAMTFVYVTGTGTDSTGTGQSMWARVKGRTENALLAMPFKAAYMFRPGPIMPLMKVESKTPLYRVAYAVFGVLLPMITRLFPDYVVTSVEVGKAMIAAARHGAPKALLEPKDIAALAKTV